MAEMRTRHLRLVHPWRKSKCWDGRVAGGGFAGPSDFVETLMVLDWLSSTVLWRDRKRNFCFLQAAVILYFLSQISEPHPNWYRAQKLWLCFLCCHNSLSKTHAGFIGIYKLPETVCCVCSVLFGEKWPAAIHLTFQILSFLMCNQGWPALTSAELISKVDMICIQCTAWWILPSIRGSAYLQNFSNSLALLIELKCMCHLCFLLLSLTKLAF